MVKVLDGEKNGHGEGEKTDQAEDNLKAEAFIKLNLSHQMVHLSRLKRGKVKQTQLFLIISNRMRRLSIYSPIFLEAISIPKSLSILSLLKIWRDLQKTINSSIFHKIHKVSSTRTQYRAIFSAENLPLFRGFPHSKSLISVKKTLSFFIL